MSHMKTVPARQEYWEHFNASFRRVGAPGDNSERRFVKVSYAGFKTEADAEAGSPAPAPHCHLEIQGNVVDRFFLDSETGEFMITEAKIGAYLVWYLTGNPTQAELERCPKMEQNRANMEGVTMFGGTPVEFIVTELPTERAQ